MSPWHTSQKYFLILWSHLLLDFLSCLLPWSFVNKALRVNGQLMACDFVRTCRWVQAFQKNILLQFLGLKIEETHSTETLVPTYRSTRCLIAEHFHLELHRLENLKYKTFLRICLFHQFHTAHSLWQPSFNYPNRTRWRTDNMNIPIDPFCLPSL